MSSSTTSFMMDGLQAVRGAIHVHTAYGDGDASMDEVVSVAEGEGLDFLAITDHHEPLAARDGWSGRSRTQGMLVVVGTEYRTLDRHDILGFGLTATVATPNLETDDALRLLSNLGSVTFIAHPQGHQPLISRKLHPWYNYGHESYDGLEIWNYMHDWIRAFTFWRLPGMCRRPDDFIRGPEQAVLKAWDLQAMVRRVAGIGALDSHGRKLPFGLSFFIPWARNGILPYAQNFAAFSHYAMVPTEWGNHDRVDQEALVTALKNGHGWACYDTLASGREFIFMIKDGDDYFPVGSEREFNFEQMLIVSTPKKAEITLLCRGEVVARANDHALEFIPSAPGEYRVEVHLNGRPWIYSNHIYLRG